MANNNNIDTGLSSNSKRRELVNNFNGTHLVPTNRPDVFGLIDSADAEVVGRFSWLVHKSSHCEYLQTTIQAKGIKTRLKLHHLIAGKPLNGMEIDHINRNTFDNRRSNLRIVTHLDNARNRKRKNPLGYIGVVKKKSKFSAQIEIKNRCINLGSRDTPEEAARLYDAACELLGHDPQFGNRLPLSLEDYYQAYHRLNQKLNLERIQKPMALKLETTDLKTKTLSTSSGTHQLLLQFV